MSTTAFTTSAGIASTSAQAVAVSVLASLVAGFPLATPAEPAGINNIKGLDGQPCSTALIERKGVLGAVANRLSARSVQEPSEAIQEAPTFTSADVHRAAGEAKLQLPVREGRKHDCGHPHAPLQAPGLAHPSLAFPIVLNASWRVVDDPLQWIVEERKGNPRSKNSGWRGRLFFRTREGLFGLLREYCGELGPSALASLMALPERHR
jgi:hypothetical protein